MRLIPQLGIASFVYALLTACGSFGTNTPDVNADASLSPDASSQGDAPSQSDASSTEPSDDARADCTPPPRGARFVFVTEGEFYGQFGIAAADKQCSAEAARAKRCGSYAAWLSGPAGSALERLPEDGVWVDMDGATVFASRAAIPFGPVKSISLAASRRQVANTTPVWTGTNNDGTTAAAHCDGWTKLMGTGQKGAVGSAAHWTDDGTLGCSSKAHFLCFGL